MDKNKEEGNLVSFRVFLARDGNVISEFSHLPLGEIDDIFSPDEIPIIRKIIKEGCSSLEGLHYHLEREVQEINI
jgi:hypothetical protein